MPHSHSPFPPGKGGKPYGKNVQMSKSFCLNIVWLNRTHSLLKLQTKFSIYALSFSKIPVNYTNSAQFAHILRELREIHTFHVPIILYVSDPCHSKELYKIPANQAEFTQFAHILRELRQIRTNY